MEHKSTFIEPLVERAEIYGKTSLELLKLKALDKTTNVLSTLISHGIIFFTVASFLAIANIGISIWLGAFLGELYYGFFCVAGFYAVLAIVLYFFMRKRIKKSIGNFIISQMLN